MSSNPPLPQGEIEDWFSNPITEHFFGAINDILSGIEETKAHAFEPGNPAITHERHSWALGAEWMLGQLLDMKADKVIRRMDYE